MNCQSIREAIDTATRRSGHNETVTAHLTGCSDCNRHANEMSSLLSLLSAQPRVQAPADFDFRLRARMARAKSEPRTANSLFEKVWAKSFSFGQAATAMAALAVAITASTFYFTHPNEMSVTGNDVATTVAAPASGQPVTIVSAPAKPTAAPAAKPALVRATAASYRLNTAASAKPIPAAIETAVAKNNLNDGSSRLYSRSNGQVITTSPNRGLIGAEGAELAKAQTVALSF